MTGDRALPKIVLIGPWEPERDRSRPATPATGPGSGSPLDDTDRAIVEALRQDGRRPYGAIAADVGLSEAAVRRRVHRLRHDGVLRIVAVIDPLQLGRARQALVGIVVDGEVRPVATELAALDEVSWAVVCTGSFDVLAEVSCEDDGALLNLLERTIRGIDGVRRTETFLYLEPVTDDPPDDPPSGDPAAEPPGGPTGDRAKPRGAPWT